MRRLLWRLSFVLALWAPSAAGLAVTPAGDLPPHPVTRVPCVKLDGTGKSVAAREAAAEARQRTLDWRALAAQRQASLRATLGPDHVSRRSLARLAERGLGPARRAAGAMSATNAAAADTLRVLIVRIGFDTDRSGDLTSVTTDGDFQLAPDETTLIDPPPHNRAFFESHLYGLSQYYTFQSGGRLVIQGRVVPDGENDCYRLSDLADYGPGAGGLWTLAQLEHLVRDMVGAADGGLAGDGVNLSDFGDGHPFTYVIFVHAGSDWQSDVAQDSPNDVPTFFVTLGEPVALQGGGALSEFSVIPETTSQDGKLGSIAAALYHEFGHALGLPDIYDTSSGWPCAGTWTLMDAGTNVAAAIGFATPTPANPDSVLSLSVYGLLPPSLGAWEKWFLGWIDTTPLDGSLATYRLPAVQVPRRDYPLYRGRYDFRTTDPQALLGGASAHDFFLMENRWVPLRASELPDQEGVGFLRDDLTGVILYLAGDDPDGDDGPLPPRNTGMYDYFLEDGGLLVWHVNEQRIEATLADNAINTDGDGLRLVEADGIQDIGTSAVYAQGWWGSPADPFHAAKPGVGGSPGSPATAVTLGVEGAPSSRAVDRSWTGVHLTDISANDAVMTLGAQLEPLAAATPWELPPFDETDALVEHGAPGPRALDPTSVMPCRIAAHDALVYTDAPRAAWGDTLFTRYGATLFAVRQDGTPLASSPSGLPDGAVHRFAAPLAGPPLVLPAAGGEAGALIVAATRDGTLAAFRPTFGEDNLIADWTRRVGVALPFAPVPAGPTGLLCCLAPDTLLWLDADGATVGRAPLGSPVTAFRAAPRSFTLPGDTRACLVFTDAGWLVAPAVYAADASPRGSDAVPYGFAGGEAPLGAAVLPDADGTLVIVCGPAGELRTWRLDGVGAAAVPGWRTDLDGAAIGEPAIADLDGDGRLDLIVVTAARTYAFSRLGVPLRGWPLQLRELFPLPEGTAFAGAPIVFDADGDGRNEVFLATDGGHLVGLSAVGRLLARTPFLWGGGAASGLCVGPAAAQTGRIVWLADGGGETGPPLERRWRNGRLVGYRLPDSGSAVLASSEWLGLGGSAARGGPVGQPHDLGALSPVRAETDRVVVYPNPARAPRVTVRFFSASSEPAHVTLHNLAGEVVAEAAVPAQAGAVNEYVWDLPRLASGLYIVRLEATGPAGRRLWLTRLAVER